MASYQQWSQRQNDSDPGSEESKWCKCWSLDFVINLDFRRRGFHNLPVSHESKIPYYRYKFKQLTISKFMMSHRALKSLPKVCKNLKESSNMFLFLSLSLSITVRVCVCVCVRVSMCVCVCIVRVKGGPAVWSTTVYQSRENIPPKNYMSRLWTKRKFWNIVKFKEFNSVYSSEKEQL